jgi:hypothetical protein
MHLHIGSVPLDIRFYIYLLLLFLIEVGF